jgi:menaquinone-dependent protoporphyrinogen oxidase
MFRSRAVRVALLPVLLLAGSGCGPTLGAIEARHGAPDAASRVLVAYGTWAGSTAEVADEIGWTLSRSGVMADVLPVQSVKDLAPYTAFVIGSGIRAGKVQGDVLDFVRLNRAALATKPTAFFIVCMTLHEDTPANRASANAYLDPLRAEVAPVDAGLFAGKLDHDKLGLFASLLARAGGGPPGDHRNWGAIRQWSEALSGRLRVPHTP